MPPGGDGFYYFSTYLLVHAGEFESFSIEINEEVICTAHAEQREATYDESTTSCSAVAFGTEGKLQGYKLTHIT